MNLDARAIVPLLKSVADEFEIGVGAAGIVVTAYMIPYGVLQLVYGPIADRVGRVAVARVALVSFGIAAGACGFASSLETLTVFRFLAGATAAAIFPMGLAYIGDSFDYRDRPAAISVLMTASASGNLMSLALGGVLAGTLGWRAMFVVSACMTMVTAIGLFAVRTRPAPPSPGGTMVAYREVLGSGRAMALCGLGFVEGVVMMAGMSYYGAFLRETWLLPYEMIGGLLAANGIGAVVMSRLLPVFASRTTESLRFLVGMLLCALAFAVSALVTDWWPTTLMLVLMGAAFVYAHTVLQAQSTEVLPRRRGTVIAVFACLLFTGGALGTALLGWTISAAGYGPSFLGIAAGFVVLAVLGWLLLSHRA